MKNVLLLSATASAINLIRTLRDEPDVRLFVTDANRYAPGLYMEGVVPIVVPRARDLERYRLALEQILARHAIDVLIPTSDQDVEGVCALLDQGWNPAVAMFRPAYAVQQTLAHKGRLMAVLTEKLPHLAPRTLTAAECKRAHELGFPLVAKPVDEGGSRGVAIVHTPADLEVQVRRLRLGHGDRFVLQEYIPGAIGCTYVVLLLYDQAGGLAGAVSMQSHLTYFTWGGGGNAGSMVFEPEMIAAAAAVIDACGGWRGPINVEFRRHAGNGRDYVMEANCRLNGYSYLSTMNGFDVPRAMLSLLTGRRSALPRHGDAACDRTFILGCREQLVDEWIREL
jgi:predicted ATP-grasp superfamily ATP-dependent carboligase